MRLRSALTALGSIMLLAHSAGASTPLGDMPRVRALNAQAVTLVAEARTKSQTVRDLLKALEGGDTIAYVQIVPAAEGTPPSTLRFVGASHTARFVLIQLADCTEPCRRIERLGHELQLAVDVAGRAWITDDAQLQRMLVMTGWADGTSARGYETAAALEAERQVRRELRGSGGPLV